MKIEFLLMLPFQGSIVFLEGICALLEGGVNFYRLAVNCSTWGSIGPNGSVNLLIDLRWEEFISGSFQARQEPLEPESMFQQDFYK